MHDPQQVSAPAPVTPPHPFVEKLRPWQLAVVAFVAMFLHDVSSTSMTIFEAHYVMVIAGLFDVVGTILSLVDHTLAIGSVLQNGWRHKRSVIIIVSVAAADFSGTLVGVLLSAALAHHHGSLF